LNLRSRQYRSERPSFRRTCRCGDGCDRCRWSLHQQDASASARSFNLRSMRAFRTGAARIVPAPPQDTPVRVQVVQSVPSSSAKLAKCPTRRIVARDLDRRSALTPQAPSPTVLKLRLRWNGAVHHQSAIHCPRRSPLACTERDLLVPKPFKGTNQGSKPPVIERMSV
jgi:hypothetical protein